MSLYHHCFHGNLLGVQQCLANGADVNSDCGRIPLHVSVIKGNLDIVRELLNAGALIDIRDDKHGHTALHWASLYGYVEIIRELIYRGIHVDIKNIQGRTSLHVISYCDIFDNEDDRLNAQIAKEL